MLFSRLKRDLTHLYLLFVLLVGVVSCASKSKDTTPIPEPSEIDAKSPPTIKIQGLADGDFVSNKSSIKIKYRVENFPLGEHYQKLVVRLNSESPQELHTNSGVFELEEGLNSGANVLRLYLVRAWGESIKNPESNSVLAFYFKEKVGILPLVSKLPVLTLVSPRGEYFGELGKKVLFDLLVQGKAAAQLKKPVMLRYSLNGALRELPLVKTVFFEHLPTGSYLLKVDLIKKPAVSGSVDLAHEEMLFQIKDEIKE